MSQTNRVIAANVKRLRLDGNLTVSDLAKKAKVSRATIYRVESGEGGSSVETLMIVAKVLGGTMDDLLEMGPGLTLAAPTARYARRAKKRVVTEYKDCTNKLCKVRATCELADFLGHDMVGHRALNALTGFTDIKTPEDLTGLSNQDMKYLPNVGHRIRDRIEECRERAKELAEPVGTSALITNLLNGERVYNVERNISGFGAVVSPDGEQWYEVEVIVNLKKTAKPKKLQEWEGSLEK